MIINKRYGSFSFVAVRGGCPPHTAATEGQNLCPEASLQAGHKAGYKACHKVGHKGYRKASHKGCHRGR